MCGDIRLLSFYKKFEKEVDIQRSTFVLALDGRYTLGSGTPRLNQSAGWYCLIYLHDAWARFCRNVLCASARGGACTLSGRRLSRSPLLKPGEHPLVGLKREWKKNKMGRMSKQGPPVHIPEIAIQAAGLLSIGNYTEFQAGIGAVSPAPSELKACRDFLAHRHRDTVQTEAIADLRRRLGIPAGWTTVGALAATFVPGGITLFEDWCIELCVLARAAIE